MIKCCSVLQLYVAAVVAGEVAVGDADEEEVTGGSVWK